MIYWGNYMKKFEGWKTEELQYVASLIAGRDMVTIFDTIYTTDTELYQELIREIRNRRIKEELFQMKLNQGEEE